MRWTAQPRRLILPCMKKPPLSQFLRRIDRSRNMARFYALSVEPDLFGGAALVRQWAVSERSVACVLTSTRPPNRRWKHRPVLAARSLPAAIARNSSDASCMAHARRHRSCLIAQFLVDQHSQIQRTALSLGSERAQIATR